MRGGESAARGAARGLALETQVRALQLGREQNHLLLELTRSGVEQVHFAHERISVAARTRRLGARSVRVHQRTRKLAVRALELAVRGRVALAFRSQLVACRKQLELQAAQRRVEGARACQRARAAAAAASAES